MGDWQLSSSSQVFSMVGTSSDYQAQVISAAGTANTKGSWSELEEITTVDASVITVMIPGLSNADHLIDIGIGASGSEQVIAANLSVSQGNSSYGDISPFSVRIPISIPIGSRVAARLQSTNTSGWVHLGIILESNNDQKGGRLITIGADTSDSGGLLITSGASVKGSWISLTSSLENDIKAAFFCFGNRVNTGRTDCTWLIDIGVGGVGSEEVLIPDLTLSADVYSDAVRPLNTPVFGVSIPAGVRVSVRAACSISDATDSLFDIIMYGIV